MDDGFAGHSLVLSILFGKQNRRRSPIAAVVLFASVITHSLTALSVRYADKPAAIDQCLVVCRRVLGINLAPIANECRSKKNAGDCPAASIA